MKNLLERIKEVNEILEGDKLFEEIFLSIKR